MTDLVARLRSALLYQGHGEESDLPEQAADEIERLCGVLRTIVFRADAAKELCEQGAPVSAFNLASCILGQIGADAATLRADG